MARDYAKQRKPAARRPRTNTRKSKSSSTAIKGRTGGWRWYIAGLLSGVFLSFLLYLGTLAPDPGSAQVAVQPDTVPMESEPPKPRFDFYTLLPEQTIDVELDPGETEVKRTTRSTEFYLLQAGSFKQREDADRRRAQLLLLGLDPKIEEANGDNGRWYRVYLGPFQSRAKLSKARSLTAAQDIDTLLLKRSSP